MSRVVEGVASGVALIFVADDGENMIGVASGANHRLTPDDIDRLPDVVVPRGRRAAGRPGDPAGDRDSGACGAAADAGMLTILNPAPVPALSESRGARACSRRPR